MTLKKLPDLYMIYIELWHGGQQIKKAMKLFTYDDDNARIMDLILFVRNHLA